MDFKKNEDECESGSAGNLSRIVIAVTSNRMVTDLVQGRSDPGQVLCLFTQEVLSEKRKLVQSTAPIKQHPKTTGINHPFLPLVHVGHYQLTETRSANGQMLTSVLRPEMCKMPFFLE